MQRIALIVFACLTLLVSAATAHPGHGLPGDGTSLHHYLTEPVHVVELVALLLGVVSAWSILRGRGRRAPSVRQRTR